MIKLKKPLKQIYITQPFSENYANFYQLLGLKGHNGIDFACNRGIQCFAAHRGLVTWAGEGSDGGIGCTIWEDKKKFKTIYYHFKSVSVKEGDWVEAGEEIGRCDNTGKYTTGDHLHFGLKMTDDIGRTINYQNGYKGAIDPKPYFKKSDLKPNCWNGYGHVMTGFNKNRKWMLEFKARAYLSGLWKRRATWEEVMAYTYGEWMPQDIHNLLFRVDWMYHKKGDKLDFNKRGKLI